MIAWLLSAPWVAIYIVMASQSSQVDPYVMFFVQTTAPAFLIGFTFFYLADLVNIKIGILETSETKAPNSSEKGNDEKECSEDEKSLLRDSERDQQLV